MPLLSLPAVLSPAATFPSAALAPLAALTIAVALDLAFGEPPARVHPVALFGSVAGRFDRPWSRPRPVGVAVAVVFPIGAASAAAGSVVAAAVFASSVTPFLSVAVAGVALSVTVSLRMLLATAAEVVDLTETDPGAARASLRALAGRDPAALSPADLRSATVESAAENLADGFVAPLAGFALGVTAWFAAEAALGSPVGGLGGALAPAAGVAAAVWVKAVNTLDSMLGYRSKPVGWASARLDDAVMFVPARATAGCLAVAAGSLAALRRGASWAREPGSPNSGWPMATAAAALDARLAKPDHYVLNPDASPPSADTARSGVRLVGVAGGVAVALVAGWVVTVGWLSTAGGAVGWLSTAAGAVGWLSTAAGVVG